MGLTVLAHLPIVLLDRGGIPVEGERASSPLTGQAAEDAGVRAQIPYALRRLHIANMVHAWLKLPKQAKPASICAGLVYVFWRCRTKGGAVIAPTSRVYLQNLANPPT